VAFWYLEAMDERAGFVHNRFMQPHSIASDERIFMAASQSSSYVVVAADDIFAFPSYREAEAFASRQESAHEGSVTVARVIFKNDGSPYRVKPFPTPYAQCSFERARREFGLL
jgi:hypothetical protein